MSAHYVYRVFDADSRLIYVGCTKDLFRRLHAHQLSSWWAYQGVSVQAQVYSDKAVALDVERDAIRTLKPRWNLHGRGSRETWSADEYVDYVTATLNIESNCVTFGRIAKLQNLARHYRFRFGEELPVSIPSSEVA